MICAECLAKTRARPASSRSVWGGLSSAMAWVMGFGLGFLFFYSVGRVLLTVPAAYHDGTIWRKAWGELQPH